MRRVKKGYKAFTEQDFEKIKTLQGVGLTLKQATDISGRSGPTVRRVYKMPSWEAHVKAKEEFNEAQKAKQEAEARAPSTLYEPKAVPSQSPDNIGKTVASDSSEDLVVALTNLNDTLIKLGHQFDGFEEKLDDALSAKRPWMNNITRR